MSTTGYGSVEKNIKAIVSQKMFFQRGLSLPKHMMVWSAFARVKPMHRGVNVGGGVWGGGGTRYSRSQN